MATIRQVINISWNDVTIGPWHENDLTIAFKRMKEKMRPKIEP